MPNVFKNAHENITVANQVTDIYSPTGTDVSIVLELDVANIANTLLQVSVNVTDDSESTSAYLVKNAPVPTGGTLQVVSGQKIILEAGDKIQVEATGIVDVVAAVLEDVNL
tara:strand:+ start:313 stop:645 length:333 start_codon:yes stop_codon:yes gene_type:complete